MDDVLTIVIAPILAFLHFAVLFNDQ